MKTLFKLGICIIAFTLLVPNADPDQTKLILYHELDTTGNIIGSIALSDGMIELMTATVAALVFLGIISWVIAGEEP